MSEELKPCPVTRWDAINDGMADDPIEFMECEDGDWVQYEDAARLERERDEARREAAEATHDHNVMSEIAKRFERERAADKAEIARLNALIAAQAEAKGG